MGSIYNSDWLALGCTKTSDWVALVKKVKCNKYIA